MGRTLGGTFLRCSESGIWEVVGTGSILVCRLKVGWATAPLPGSGDGFVQLLQRGSWACQIDNPLTSLISISSQHHLGIQAEVPGGPAGMKGEGAWMPNPLRPAFVEAGE